MALQASKYIALLVVGYLMWLAILSGYREIGRRIHFTVSELWLAAFGGWIVGTAFMREGFSPSESLSLMGSIGALAAIIPIILAVACWLRSSGNAGHQVAELGRATLRILAVVVVLNAAASVLQLLLFLQNGRLPALGYSSGVVRFGGLWDDPNQAAVFAAMAILVAAGISGVRGRVPMLIWGPGLVTLVLAWSYSGWLTLIFGTMLLWRKNGLVGMVKVAGSLTLVLLLVTQFGKVVEAAESVPVVETLVRGKSGSVEKRLELVQQGEWLEWPSSAGEWLVGFSNPPHTETAVLHIFYHGGLIGAGLFACWLITALVKMARHPTTRRALPALGAFLISSVFVPYLVIFPLGSLYVAAVTLMATFPVAAEQFPVTTEHPTRPVGAAALPRPPTSC